MRRPILLLVFGAATACFSPPPRAPAPTAAPAARTALDALEGRLLAASTLRIRARIASGGRIESRFDGTVVAGAGQRMRIALEGWFGGRNASAHMVCDGMKMQGGSREQRFEFDAPPALREGVVVGFVRMGLARAAALLAMGKPPDHIDGSARQSLEVVGAAHAPSAPIRGAPTERWTWALLVDHKPAADEELWIDTRTDLPVRRRATVHFPEGDMDLGEEYDEVALDAPVDDATFAILP